jgi:hypothetical protein
LGYRRLVPSTSIPAPESRRWEVIAEQLERDAVEPTSEQIRVATAIGVTLPTDIPAPVAVIVLRDQLSDVLFARVAGGAEIPDALRELEDELDIATPAHLVTGTREEVSAWFAARYMIKTARGRSRRETTARRRRGQPRMAERAASDFEYRE